MIKVKPRTSKIKKLKPVSHARSTTTRNLNLKVQAGGVRAKVNALKQQSKIVSSHQANLQRLQQAKATGAKVRRSDIRFEKRAIKRGEKRFKAMANEAAITKRLAITTAGTTATSMASSIASSINGGASYGVQGRQETPEPTNPSGSNPSEETNLPGEIADLIGGNQYKS